MSAETPVSDMMERLKNGDEDVVAELWSHFFHRLRGLAQKRLLGAYVAEGDGEDVALSAIRTFCRRVLIGQYSDVTGEEALWDLLAAITTNKSRKLRRRHTQLKRDWRRTVQGSNPVEDDSGQSLIDGLVNRSLQPDLKVEALESVRYLLGILEDDRERRIVLYKLDGLTNEEIRKKEDVSISTVERILNVIRSHWREELERDD